MPKDKNKKDTFSVEENVKVEDVKSEEEKETKKVKVKKKKPEPQPVSKRTGGQYVDLGGGVIVPASEIEQ